MAAIVPETVYTKTAKGILEARNKSTKLPRELGPVLQAIDGKANVAEILSRAGMATPQLHQALNSLVSDGYIKPVASSTPPPGAVTEAADAVAFTASPGLPQLNMEAASHALAESEAQKDAQQQARTALDARLRAEAEARARALAEVRAQSESEARAKAEAAARSAAEARADAEREAAAAPDAATRASAEARARTAAAAAVRAEAEARARSEAEARARALVDEKKAAEERARAEAEMHERDQSDAQARAANEARARENVEARIEALANAPAAEDHAVQVHALAEAPATPEPPAEFPAISQAPVSAADDAATPALDADFGDLAQRLTARVHAERRARDEAERKHREAQPPTADMSGGADSKSGFPALEFASSDTPADSAATAPSPDLPNLSFVSTTGAGDVKHTTPSHVPSALERAMMESAARAEAEEAKKQEKTPSPAEASAAKTAPHIVILKHAPSESDSDADESPPELDESAPLEDRVNVDRTAHDLLAESAEARRRTEAAQLARATAAKRRQRAQEDARRAEHASHEHRRRQAIRALAVVLIGLPALGVLFLQFVPLESYTPAAQQAISQRLNQPTTISRLRYVLLPSPRLILEGVRIGSAQDVRIDRVDAYAWPTIIMSEPKVFDQVDATGVTIDQAMLSAVPSWTGGRSAAAVHVARLRLSDVKLSIPQSGLEGLSGDVTFEPNGTIRQAMLGNEKLKVELTPQQGGLRVALNARDWRAPFGPPVPFTFLTIDGLAEKQRFGTTALSGRIGGGALSGSLAARWDGPVIVGGDFKIEGAKLEELMAAAAPNLKMRGSLAATGRYALQSDSATGAFGRPLVEAAFSITRGELSSIDLVRALQTGGSLRGGGRTGFEELTGSLHVNGARYSYRQLQLSSGPLNARGNVELVAGSQLNGRIDAAFDMRGAVARASFRITGTVKEPQVQR